MNNFKWVIIISCISALAIFFYGYQVARFMVWIDIAPGCPNILTLIFMVYMTLLIGVVIHKTYGYSWIKSQAYGFWFVLFIQFLSDISWGTILFIRFSYLDPADTPFYSVLYRFQFDPLWYPRMISLAVGGWYFTRPIRKLKQSITTTDKWLKISVLLNITFQILFISLTKTENLTNFRMWTSDEAQMINIWVWTHPIGKFIFENMIFLTYFRRGIVKLINNDRMKDKESDIIG